MEGKSSDGDINTNNLFWCFIEAGRREKEGGEWDEVRVGWGEGKVR